MNDDDNYEFYDGEKEMNEEEEFHVIHSVADINTLLEDGYARVIVDNLSQKALDKLVHVLTKIY